MKIRIKKKIILSIAHVHFSGRDDFEKQKKKQKQKRRS